MRLALRAVVAVGLLLALLSGTSAFNFGSSTGRAISVDIVGDASAYLALAANTASPHDCFVSESGTTGKLSVSFAAASGCDAAGAGTGVNAGLGSDSAKFTRYAFHDLLLVTNKGTNSILLWVNATSTTGTLDVAKKTSSGAMTDADYAASSATSVSLTVGSTAYVGLRVNTTTLSSGNVAGTVALDAWRTG